MRLDCIGAQEENLLQVGLSLVYQVAWRYRRISSVSLEELVAAGNEGLMYALRRFDSKKGTSFVAWARRWIHYCIQKLLRDLHPIACVPVEIRRLGLLIFKENQRRKGLGLPALNKDEVVSFLGVREDMALRAWAWSEEGGFECFIEGHEEIVDWADVVESKEDIVDEVLDGALARDIERAIECAGLTEKERVVIELAYGLGGGRPLSLREIGGILGVTHQAVGYSLRRALAKLSDGRAGEILRGHLDGIQE